MATAPKAVRYRAVRTFKRAHKSPLIFLERLPLEILLKILSYLDVSALYTLSHVNKLFYQLANDNVLWEKIHKAEHRRKRNLKCDCTYELLQMMSRMEVEDPPENFWKHQHLNSLIKYDTKTMKSHLGILNRHTGLPSRTRQVLRSLRVTWELTVSDKSGQKSTFEPNWCRFCETSVSLSWSGGGQLSDYKKISSLHLHGVRRIALNVPGLKTPGRRFLMLKVDMQAVAERMQIIGRDKLVDLKLLQPGIVLGVWREINSKDQSSVAFVMFTLHFHRLVERSTQESPLCPILKPMCNDVDPEHGLHGYQLHVALNDTTCNIMSEHFSQLFCRKADIGDGLMRLRAISRANASQHARLAGSVGLPWSCESLQGNVQNGCVLSVTLVDSYQRRFWCVGSAVSVQLRETPVCYDYDGEHFLILHQDSEGRVEMQLVKEQTRFVVVSLAVSVAVGKVNKHFGTSY
ncbi:hypothetical protein CgunFtcFv8_015882 [Champsocephalus gunnari]|uniref:F-box domain-containing protein n=1 Tax=Champsocephalus gunnari TaxID=52237 RepID=A0AAN8C7N5_CHAGU|nr:hypothetical protein CgunFtcFv8_015882 [Champsocephalus gunnari]